MHFQFLLSGPHGDIEPLPETLARPFLISPEEEHPFLTLADYFGALQQLLMLADGRVVLAALKKKGGQAAQELAAASTVLLRSEKHGAYYHIASVEIAGPGAHVKFAVTTALPGPAKATLEREYKLLQELAGRAPSYLPEVFCRERVAWKTDRGVAEFLMVAGEWLAGYHEWHASPDTGSGKQRIQLWDYDNGFRFLSDAESYEIMRQAACILTCCYDQSSFCQIYPWHHGAGDFVVSPGPGGVSVKLVTARQYGPLVHFDGEEPADRVVAAIHFLLNLCLRMRLDRLNGVGAPAWLDEFAVHAAVEGFFSGLAAVTPANRLQLGPVVDFLEIMKAFDAREICGMYESLLQIYAEEDEDDFRLIQEKLPGHAEELHEALQRFSPEKQ
jgi:hypothetical protein